MAYFVDNSGVLDYSPIYRLAKRREDIGPLITPLIIGRNEDCDLPIPALEPRADRDLLLNHPSNKPTLYNLVSGQHCSFDLADKRLIDLGSTHGTFVNDNLIGKKDVKLPSSKKGVVLKNGSRVKLGSIQLIFYDGDI